MLHKMLLKTYIGMITKRKCLCDIDQLKWYQTLNNSIVTSSTCSSLTLQLSRVVSIC